MVEIAIEGNVKMIETKCPDCGSINFFNNRERGEVICRDCSFVVAEGQVDFGSETRSFEFEDVASKSRSGAPFDPRVANNLTTQIGTHSDLDKLSKKQRVLMQRIRKKNNWTSNSLEINLNTAMTNLKMIASYLKLPGHVEKEAAVIYRRSAENDLTIKRSIESIVVASLFIASRMYGIPKAMDEFVEASKISKKVLGKTYKLVMRELNIKIAPTDPLDFIERYGSQLGLSAKVQTNAIKMIEQAKRKQLLSGLSPISVAATTLYLSGLKAGERRTQKVVAETTGITEATLRSRTKDLIKNLSLKVQIR